MDETRIVKQEDAWPEAETVAYAAPPAPPVAPPPAVAEPAEPPPSRSIGNGLLVGLLLVALIGAGAAIAYYLAHRDSGSKASTVTVTTAGTPADRSLAVPSVVGSTRADAVSRLRQAGLVPQIQVAQSTKPSGTVLSQRPAAAQGVARGSQVLLVVAGGTEPPATATTTPTTTAAAPPQPATATVPDVQQQSEASAVQALGQAGILASLAFVPGQDELGTVEAQAKQAGSTVPYHGHVQINLSSGPGQKQSEQVPNVIGQTVKQALASINGAHLRLIYLRIPVTSPSQAWKVVQQSPLGGGSAPQNAQVVIYVGALKK
jgi:beta-lactam-binding protein with PASTA domain